MTHQFEHSTTIHHIEFDQERNVLTVEFHHGGRYEYPCDSYQKYQDFCEAKSPGSHFHKIIKLLGEKKI